MVESPEDIAEVRARLEKAHGQVWDTEELQRDYTVTGFLAPFVGVVRKSDGVEGSMMFQARPRFYFGFEPK
jgi:hypothetical protein